MCRTLLGEWEAIAQVTASVCRDFRVDLYSCRGNDAAHGVWCDNRQELSLQSLFHVAGAERGDVSGCETCVG